MTETKPDLGRMAEDFIRVGTWRTEVIDQLSDVELDMLFDHLSARASVEMAAESETPELAALNEVQLDEAATLHSFYLAEAARAAPRPSEQEMLAKPATWLKIEPIVRDRDFLIRAAQRRLQDMAVCFVSDMSDWLGVSKDALLVFFSGAAGEGLAMAENRNRGKPKDDGTEDFQTALSRSEIPEVLKRRWMEG